MDLAGCSVNAQQVIAADKHSRLPGADDAGDAVFASHDRGMAQTAAEVCDDAGYLVNMGKPFWTVHRGDGDTVSGQVPIVATPAETLEPLSKMSLAVFASRVQSVALYRLASSTRRIAWLSRCMRARGMANSIYIAPTSFLKWAPILLRMSTILRNGFTTSKMEGLIKMKKVVYYILYSYLRIKTPFVIDPGYRPLYIKY